MGRKKYSKELKARIALDAIKGQKTIDVTTSILFFKVVQNVYVSWIFLGGLCLSLNNKVGGYPVEGGGVYNVANLLH